MASSHTNQLLIKKDRGGELMFYGNTNVDQHKLEVSVKKLLPYRLWATETTIVQCM
jgi:hypothetical protein